MASSSDMQRRRNRGGNGGACAGLDRGRLPPKCWNRGEESNNLPSLSAERLPYEPTNVPKLLAAGAFHPDPIVDAIVILDSLPGGEEVFRPLPRTPPPAELFELRASTLRASPRPRNVDFVPTPLLICQRHKAFSDAGRISKWQKDWSMMLTSDRDRWPENDD